MTGVNRIRKSIRQAAFALALLPCCAYASAQGDMYQRAPVESVTNSVTYDHLNRIIQQLSNADLLSVLAGSPDGILVKIPGEDITYTVWLEEMEVVIESPEGQRYTFKLDEVL